MRLTFDMSCHALIGHFFGHRPIYTELPSANAHMDGVAEVASDGVQETPLLFPATFSLFLLAFLFSLFSIFFSSFFPLRRHFHYRPCYTCFVLLVCHNGICRLLAYTPNLQWQLNKKKGGETT